MDKYLLYKKLRWNFPQNSMWGLDLQKRKKEKGIPVIHALRSHLISV